MIGRLWRRLRGGREAAASPTFASVLGAIAFGDETDAVKAAERWASAAAEAQRIADREADARANSEAIDRGLKAHGGSLFPTDDW